MTPLPFKGHALGFSLIEVLISILILSFGVLAMGGLQLATLKSNQIAGKLIFGGDPERLYGNDALELVGVKQHFYSCRC